MEEQKETLVEAMCEDDAKGAGVRTKQRQP